MAKLFETCSRNRTPNVCRSQGLETSVPFAERVSTKNTIQQKKSRDPNEVSRLFSFPRRFELGKLNGLQVSLAVLGLDQHQRGEFIKLI
jgi:hypothetical protein